MKTPLPHPTLVPGLFLSKSDLAPAFWWLGEIRINLSRAEIKVNLHWLPWVLHCLSPAAGQ